MRCSDLRYRKGMRLREYWNEYNYYREETNELFDSFAGNVKKRGYLTRNDLMRIFLWKADRVVERNEDELNKVTRRVFEVDHENEGEVKRLLNELTQLDGIKIPMASVILSILFPEKYGVFDKNVRKALDGKKYTNSPKAFWDYQIKTREIAKEQSKLDGKEWFPRDVDKALWILGKKSEVKKEGVS